VEPNTDGADVYLLKALALFGSYSAALYADKTYGTFVPLDVQTDPGLFVLIFVGVVPLVNIAFADASVHLVSPTNAAIYVPDVARFIEDVVSETATNPSPVPPDQT
jgi:hypothetical protein